MRAKTFARVKETIATGGHADAVGSAQVPANYSTECVEPSNVVPFEPRKRDLSASEAHRIVARVSLGKRSTLFRVGNDPKERAEAIDELSIILKKQDGQKKLPFNMFACRCIAAVALHELTFDVCVDCSGRGTVRDHDNATLEGRQPMTTCLKCGGKKRRRYTEDDRIAQLAKEWRMQSKVRCETELEEKQHDSAIAKELRGHKHYHRLLEGIEQAKGLLLEAERIAVEETANMLERW